MVDETAKRTLRGGREGHEPASEPDSASESQGLAADRCAGWEPRPITFALAHFRPVFGLPRGSAVIESFAELPICRARDWASPIKLAAWCHGFDKAGDL